MGPLGLWMDVVVTVLVVSGTRHQARVAKGDEEDNS